MIDFYKVLNIPPEASQTEIYKAYKNQSRIYHPDKNKAPDALDHFHTIQRAFNLLSNPDSRAYYDEQIAIQQARIINEELDLNDLRPCDWDQNDSTFPIQWEHDCRCGGLYIMSCHHFVESTCIVPCDTCSLAIQVHRHQTGN